MASHCKRQEAQRHSAQTIRDADYADDIALLAKTPAKAESLLHNLKNAVGCIGLHFNVDKTEHMCFNQNQRRDISIQKRWFPETSGQIDLPWSSVSSTKNDINT